MDTRGLELVQIAGFGRSSSTLLGMMLGAQRGFMYLGELENLWARGLVQNRLCSCGAPLRACPFWLKVFQHAFGGIDRIDPHTLEDMRWAHARKWRLLGFSLTGRAHRARATPDAYQDLILRLLRAARDVSGCQTMVDSSGSAAQAALVGSLPGVDLRLLHLLRDPRGVAYSMMKRKKHQPDQDGRKYWMVRTKPGRTAVDWCVRNAGLELVARPLGGAEWVRYEDWIDDPGGALPTWFPVDAGLGGERGAWRFTPSPGHVATANPVRFARDPLVLELDSAWQTGLSAASFRLVTLITCPLLLRYGYQPGAGRSTWVQLAE